MRKVIALILLTAIGWLPFGALTASAGGQTAALTAAEPRAGLLAAIPDMWSFPDSAIQDLADAGVDVVELKAVANDPLAHPNPGGDGVMSAKGTYEFSLLDAQIRRWKAKGIRVVLEVTLNGSFRQDWWPEYYADYVAEDGSTIANRFNAYLPALQNGYDSFVQAVVGHYDGDAGVYGFYIDGPGYYGEVEMLTDNYAQPKFYSYDPNAKAAFRSYLQTVYPNVGALNAAWGSSYAGWNDVQPPLPDYALGETAIDLRRSWSDFVTWRHAFLYGVMERWLTTAKNATAKPVGIKIGGAKMGSNPNSAAFSASTADLLKLLASGGHASFFDDTNNENLSSMRHSTTIGSQYGVKIWGEGDGGIPAVSYNQQRQNAANLLMSGADTMHYAYVEWLFKGFDWNTASWTGSFEKTKPYYYLKSLHKTVKQYRPAYESSEVAFFQSHYTSWYRGSDKTNRDVSLVYDAEMTHGAYGAYASWTRYLTTPDVVDEQLILDDILSRYKVLIVPNTSSTVTLKTVGDKIKEWVHNGGKLVTFGEGALTYQIDGDRRLASPNASDPSNWSLGLSGGTAVTATASRNWRIAGGKPAWLTSLTTADQGAIPAIDKAFVSLAPGAVPVVEDGTGNTLVAESPYGAGSVLFTTTRVQNNAFFDEIMPNILSDYADSAGIRRNIRFEPSVAATYAGTNAANGKKLVVSYSGKNLMDSQYDESGGVNPRIEFSPSLTGNAEVLQFTKYYGNPSSGTPGARDTITDAIATPVTLPAEVTHYRTASPIPIYDVLTTNQNGDYPRENMIDGMIGSEDHGFWASTPAPIQTIIANTGKERVIHAVVIDPRQGFGPKNTAVSESSDGVNYAPVWSGTLPNSRKVVYFDQPVRAQFVKLHVTSSYSADTTVQIRELQLYGPESEDDSKRVAPASVSYASQKAGFPAANLHDLREDTYWRSDAYPTEPAPQSIVYDLGSTHRVNRVEIQPVPNQGPKDIDILLSADGNNYSFAYTVTSENNGQLHTFQPTAARYVKLNIRSSYGWNDVGIAEMAVYATAARESGYKEITAKTVQASSTQGYYSYNPARTLDGVKDLPNDGFWVSGKPASAENPQWLVYDLGQLRKLGMVRISPRANYGNKDTEIQLSADGIRYTKVADYIAANADQSFSFGQADARFVKLLFKSGYDAENVQIRETEFFGPIGSGSDNRLPMASVSASSVISPYAPEHLNDGLYDDNAGFYVGTEPSESHPQTVTVDLGASRTVRKIAVDSRTGAYPLGPAEAIVLGSVDGVRYDRLAAGYLTQGREIIDVGEARARYIRLYMKSSYSGDGTNQLNEIAVYGDPNDPAPSSAYFSTFSPGNAQGWTLMQSLTGYIYSNTYYLTVTGADPYLQSPDNLNIDASRYAYVKISMKNNTADNEAELYWLRDDDTVWDLAKYKLFGIRPHDDGYTEYVIDLSADPNWKGVIRQLRLAPANSASNGTIELDYVKIDADGTARPGYDPNEAMAPLWSSNTIYNESVMLVSDNGSQPEAKLHYTPIGILSVKDATLGTEFVEGKDWVYDAASGKLKLLPGTKAGFMTTSELYPAAYQSGWSMYRPGSQYILYREGTDISSRQLAVTYTKSEPWGGLVPQYAGADLPKTAAKLAAGAPLKVVLFGDSISVGSNASGYSGGSPYMPSWGRLFVRQLHDAFGSEVSLANPSMGGQVSAWGASNAGRVAAENPDLVIIAFGMNDGTYQVPPATFESNVKSIMDDVLAANANAEFILVATTLAREGVCGDAACSTTFAGNQADYKTALGHLASTYGGTVVMDMTGIHRELLQHKSFLDMTANNVNHPNDYLVRWYAQNASALLIP
ncbi:discoidin domain-containing protein [Cohnella sp. REN36]|uniref:discoidin domain-containing protein n=1 Tax=Cohnella sp. REN36 TaxID=2887347 RepID=UPI001D1354A2|nr:discoidin domain-containing protein [Cohnella sp. REN36]MCC3375272.1 discoidin domain-containing protein [Cohnella sp. REN36]